MDENDCPDPVPLFTVAVEGIVSKVPEPSPCTRASSPCMACWKVLVNSCAWTLNSPRLRPSVAMRARKETSQGEKKKTGEIAKPAHCEPEPRNKESALPV